MSETDSNVLAAGDHFRGYVVVKLLGRGAMGAVYLVRHEVLDTLYALKVLDPAIVEKDVTFLKRFLREARLATHVRHPNLVAVHDCGRDDATGCYYLVMDYVAGGSLRQALAFEGRFTVQRAAQVVAEVASALKAAQAFQVVHRDIKPENIMVQPDGHVKLVDLGIAKAQGLGDSVRTNTASIFGTPSYISPEQARCSANVDVRADIYSLGIVFFEMLTGKCPYGGSGAAQIIAAIMSDEPTPDIRDVCSGLPADVAVLVRRMTMKDCDRRLPTFDAVLEELSRLDGVSLSAMPALVAELPPAPEVGMATLLGRYGDERTSPSCPVKNADRPARRSLVIAIVIAILVMIAVGCAIAMIPLRALP